MNLLYVPGMTTGIYNALGKLGTSIVKITGIEQSYLYVVALPVWTAIMAIDCVAKSGWYGFIPPLGMFGLVYVTVRNFDRTEPELRMWIPLGLFFIRIWVLMGFIVSIALAVGTRDISYVLGIFSGFTGVLTVSLALPVDKAYDRLLYGEQEDE